MHAMPVTHVLEDFLPFLSDKRKMRKIAQKKFSTALVGFEP